MSELRVDMPEGESGKWRVERITVEPNDSALVYYSLKGRDLQPGTYTRLMHGGSVVMSDTPAEWRDHRWFIACAEGRVLISGLGIGMVIAALLARPRVERIVVIEKEADVVALVAPSYANERVRIVNADAYTWKPDERFDWAWHDIWPSICGDNVEDFGKLRRRYSKAMTAPKRQHCWCEHEARRQNRIGW